MIILQGVRQCVESLSFSPCGRRLAAPSFQGVQLWEDIVAQGKPTLLTDLGWIHSTRFTPDGRTLLLLGLKTFTYDLVKKRTTPIRTELATWTFAELTPDGESLVFAQNGDGSRSGRLFCRVLATPSRSIWSIETRRCILGPPLFLPGGQRFVLIESTGYRTGVACVTRDVRTRATMAEVAANDPRLVMPVLSADRRLIAARATNRISVFRSEDFTIPPVILTNDSRKDFTGLAFHPSGRFLAATSNDNTVKLYDAQTWQMAHAFDWEIGRLRSIAFSPDDMLAAAGGDKGKVVVWDFDL